MKFTNLISVMSVVFCPHMAKADPVLWVDRCFIEANEQESSPLTPVTITVAHCSYTILNYCNFADDSAGCFKDLEVAFMQRSDRALTTLPPLIEANEVQQNLYRNRLDTVMNLAEKLGCAKSKPQHVCDAEIALQRSQLAQTLQSLVVQMEKQK